MTASPAREPGQSPRHEVAFSTAQRAFANGWIDLDELDRRLAAIAEAPDALAADAVVSDLANVEKRIARRQGTVPTVPVSAQPRSPARKVGRVAVDVVFGLVVFATAVNLIVWATVALANGGFYFWPVWMLIPLGVVGGIWALVRHLLRDPPPGP